MSLQGGTAAVTVDGNGQPQVTGSGLALVLAQATIASALAELVALPVVGSTAPPYRPERPATQTDVGHAIAARLLLFRDKARDANAIGPALVSYLIANAQVVMANVSAQVTESLGAVPSPNTPGTAITPPPSPVSLPLAGMGTLQ
jgi:hypothetical protein